MDRSHEACGTLNRPAAVVATDAKARQVSRGGIMQMERWLLEFPATMRKAAMVMDLDCASSSMDALKRYYTAKSVDERQTIYLSLARTILEDLDKEGHRRVEGFLYQVGLLQKQKTSQTAGFR
jgi:ribosomal protein S25